MFFMMISILCFTLLIILVQIKCSAKLPIVDDTDIVATEQALRDIVNNLFSTLKLQDIKKNQKLKQYSTIYNFFISVTLQDHNNLKEIERLTKVDNIDNGTKVFITQLNEVLNEDNKSDEVNDFVYVTTLIEEFIKNLYDLKEKYGLKNSTKHFDINRDIITHLSNNEPEFENVTKLKKGNDSYGNVLSDNEFWHTSGRRIYHGETTKIQRFPFMASVQFFKKFQCAGSIISSDLIITSASCLQLAWNNLFYRENPAFLSVLIGSNFYEGSLGENVPIMEIYFHPNYNPKNLRHNLALMRLERIIKFGKNTENVKRIEFDRNPWPLPVNTNGITIVGWGTKSNDGNTLNPWKNKLSYARLDYYPLKECQEIYSKEFVTERQFCAGFFSKGGGACNHDLGGPGVIAGILVGVISFGSPVCGTPDAPTVFTKVGYYTEWIDKIIKQKAIIARFITTKRPKRVKLPYPQIIHSTSRHTVTPVVTEIDTYLRMNDKSEVFKEFISTIFESQEIYDFLDKKVKIKNRSITKSKRKRKEIPTSKTKKKSKTKTTTPIAHITNHYTFKAEEKVQKRIKTLKKMVQNYDLSPETSLEMVTESNTKRDTTDEKEIKDIIKRLIDDLKIVDVNESKLSSPEDLYEKMKIYQKRKSNPPITNNPLSSLAKKTKKKRQDRNYRKNRDYETKQENKNNEEIDYNENYESDSNNGIKIETNENSEDEENEEIIANRNKKIEKYYSYENDYNQEAEYNENKSTEEVNINENEDYNVESKIRIEEEDNKGSQENDGSYEYEQSN